MKLSKAEINHIKKRPQDIINESNLYQNLENIGNKGDKLMIISCLIAHKERREEINEILAIFFRNHLSDAKINILSIHSTYDILAESLDNSSLIISDILLRDGVYQLHSSKFINDDMYKHQVLGDLINIYNAIKRKEK